MTVQQPIPKIGFGTFRLKGQEVIDAVKSAMELGYRHIDTAQMYDNEAEIGQAIRESGVNREDLFITTKVWFDRLKGDDLINSLEESVGRLGLAQVDLALIHWPSPDDETPMTEYISALDQARQGGLTRFIGISNFTKAQVDEALSVPGGDQIVTNQIEVHPYLANRNLTQHCQSKGLQVTGYMPLAVGKVMKDPVLQEIAKNHKVTPAEIALAWVASRDIVVIPSSTKPNHQKANFEAMNLKLSTDELAQIDKLDRGERIANPDFAPAWDE